MIKFFKLFFLDIFLLFKNIIHFSLSKVIIYLWGIMLGLIISFPFVLIYNIFGDSSYLDIYINLFSGISINTLNAFIINFLYVYMSFGYIIGLILTLDFLNIIYLFGGLSFVFSFSYSYILLIKLNNNYLEGNKLGFIDNDYFNYKKILKFFNLTFLNIFILLIPGIIFILLIGLLFLISGNVKDLTDLVSAGSNNYFSIISFILLLMAVILFIYLFYRTIFSYFIMSDEKYIKKSHSVFFYIKKSFKKTKSLKKFLKFIWLLLFFVLIIFPLNFIGQLLIINGELLNIYIILFSIFNFIFIYGLFIMIFASFYKRELK